MKGAQQFPLSYPMTSSITYENSNHKVSMHMNWWGDEGQHKNPISLFYNEFVGIRPTPQNQAISCLLD